MLGERFPRLTVDRALDPQQHHDPVTRLHLLALGWREAGSRLAARACKHQYGRRHERRSKRLNATVHRAPSEAETPTDADVGWIPAFH